MDELQVDKMSNPDERMTCIYTSLILDSLSIPPCLRSTSLTLLASLSVSLKVSDDAYFMKQWPH